LYDQIIQRVIEDSRERFDAEGADTQVLGELQKVSYSRAHIPPVHCKYPLISLVSLEPFEWTCCANDVLTLCTALVGEAPAVWHSRVITGLWGHGWIRGLSAHAVQVREVRGLFLAIALRCTAFENGSIAL
jgi:hypothetical protein